MILDVRPGVLLILSLLLLSLGLFVLSLIITPILTEKGMEEALRKAGWLAPLLLIGLQTLQVVLVPIPGYAFGLLSGYLFGPFWGGLYILSGITLGGLLAFQITRTFGHPFLRRVLKASTLERYNVFLVQRGPLFLFLLFLLPGFPDDLLAFLAGLSPMNHLSFLIALVFGRLPGAFLLALAGGGVRTANYTLVGIVVACAAFCAFLAFRYQEKIRKILKTS